MRNVGQILGLSALLAIALPLSAAKHETWYEARSPNFVIVSNAGEKRTIQTARLFEQIRSVFRQSIPMVSKLPSPKITVIAVKNEESMQVLMPEDWRKGHVHHAGYFFYRMDQYYAVVELDAGGDNPYSTIYHEYYHSLTLPYFPGLPLWVAEGLAEFYGNTQIDGNEAGIGYDYPDLIDQLRTNSFIPLDRLFKVDQNSPYYNENNKTSMFYAESWALVHYLMLGDKTAHRQMFKDYLSALSEGATQEEASAKAFGSVQKLQNSLQTYIRGNSFYYLKIPVTEKISDSNITVKEISQAEAEAYEGGFLAARGRIQDGKPLLEEALREDPKLALAYQNLGVAEFLDGQSEEALASVSKAIELDPKNGLARFIRAYLSFRSGTEVSDNNELEEDLRVTIAESPDFAPAYSLLALRLAASPEDSTEALKMAQKAVSLEPGNSTYQLTLAQVLARMTKFDEAQVAGLRARADARTPVEKTQAESFLSYLGNYRNMDGEAERMARANGDAGSVETGGNANTPSENQVEEATGVVTKAGCEMGGPKLEMKTNSGTLTLHSPVSGGIQISMKNPLAGFNPCTSLEGMKVNVQYTPDEGKNSVGTLRQIEILENADSEGKGSEPDGNRDNSGKPLDASAQPGDTTKAEGKVTDLTCVGRQMLITLQAGDKEVRLHSTDYSRIEVQQETAFDTGDFALCTSLKGRHAVITFVVASQKPYHGEIQSIEVGK
jgi:tetratricopeptide (TPR) repeat protein